VRELADAGRIRQFLKTLGRAAREDSACYLTGGATAVLYGWRATTIDVDIRLVPESDTLLRAIQELKNELRINVELASPADFIPVPDGWEDRSVFVTREGKLSVYHFDLVAQALAKLERAHPQDLEDVAAMLERGLVDPAEARRTFDRIESELYRYPAIDPGTFRARVQKALSSD
jgi:hypothetical protein